MNPRLPHTTLAPLPLRSLLTLALLALLAGPPGARPLFAALESRRSAGLEYLSLGDWSRLHGLRLSRTPTSRDVSISGPSLRIDLQLDASRIEFNGTGVWLSYPVQLIDNQVFASATDVRGVFTALLQPPRLGPGKRVRVICLDPGHGGKEPGHKSGLRLEKTYTLLLAHEVRARLVEAGFTVVMTRRGDDYPELPERTAIARRNNADLFVSLHFNSTPDGSSDANGFEVYAMTPEGARSTNISKDVGSLKAWSGNDYDAENLVLAYNVQKALLGRLPGTEDRGVRRARFMVLRLAEMPAILVEGGFMSNAGDARWIVSDTGRRKMATAITEGIQAYRRQVERPASTAPQRNTSSTSSTNNSRPGSAKN